MKVIFPRMRWAASLGALVLLAGFPGGSLASRSRLNSVPDNGVTSRYVGGTEKQVYRLHGPSLTNSRGG
jgi:hypothetical protein